MLKKSSTQNVLPVTVETLIRCWKGSGDKPKLVQRYRKTEIHDIIINGQGGMPGGIIKGEEAEAVAKWRSLKRNKHKEKMRLDICPVAFFLNLLEK